MLQKFLKTVEETKTIEPKDRLVVAVSGGPDSMCLLTLLCKIRRRFGLTLCVAHVNHMLRAEEARQDAAFVRDYARQLDVPFYLHEVPVKKLSREKKIGLEEAGRQARYAFFREVMQRERADKIVTAHHMEDQAETILMRILRGTAIEGLAGIQEKRADGVVRPLLRFSKQELLNFLAQERIPYRIDRSNLELSYTRNWIRNCLMGQLQEMNPDVCSALCRLSNAAQMDCDFMQAFVSEAQKRFVTVVDSKTILIHRDLFSSYGKAVVNRVLCRAMRQLVGEDAGTSRDIQAVCQLEQKGKNGQEVSLAKNIFAALEYHQIALFQKEPFRAYSRTIPVGVGAKFPEIGLVFYAYFEKKSDIIPMKNQFVFALPQTVTQYTIRSRKAGDQYVPSGFEGHRKLKELLIDLKVPKRLRAKLPILEINGEILWVFGARASGAYSASDVSAEETVFVFEFQFMENGADLQRFLE